MANFFVTHNRYPDNPHLFTINLTKIVKKGGENNPNFVTNYPSAEPYWELIIYTTGTDSNGDQVGPIVTELIGSEETINDLVSSKVSELSSLIDWSQQGQFSAKDDLNAPIVISQLPKANQTNVRINSPIVIRVQDKVPAAGIDVSTVSMKVDGIAVTPQVLGNKYDYTFIFKPKPVYDS